MQKFNFLYVLSINYIWNFICLFLCCYQNEVRVSIKMKKVFLLGRIMFLLVSLARKKLLRLGKKSWMTSHIWYLNLISITRIKAVRAKNCHQPYLTFVTRFIVLFGRHIMVKLAKYTNSSCSTKKDSVLRFLEFLLNWNWALLTPGILKESQLSCGDRQRKLI